MLARFRTTATTLSARNCVSGRFASSLVVAEHNGSALNPNTLACVAAASKIGGDVSVLVLGHGVSGVADEASKISGVSKVLTVDNEIFKHRVAENAAKVVQSVAKNYTHIVAPSTTVGKNFVPRLGALLDSSPLSDVISVVSEDTFKRPLYAGNAIATVKMSDAIKLLLVRPTAFDKAPATGGNATKEALSVDGNAGLSAFVSEAVAQSDRPDLLTAKVVVSGGRGMKNEENFKMLEKLADKLGGAVGASRAAVDAKYISSDKQIGQTGKTVAPPLYIAVGISGAIQHLSGMKDSKTIVVINKDKEAPFFQVADYGIVDDLFKVIPELEAKLSK